MAETVTLPQAGGCLCGAVRYHLNGAPLLAYACHCHDCQRRSGAAFSLTLVVRTADVTLEGPVGTARRTNPSGREVDDSLCETCRTRLAACAPVAPDFMSLRVGTLDDASWVVPIAQTYVESAVPWAVIPGVRQVAWADFNYFTLGADWQASAPRFEATAV